MSDPDLILKMAGEVARIGAVVDDLSKLLKDNGQPGLISRFQSVEALQRECQNIHKTERETAKQAAADLLEASKRRENRIMGICIFASSFVTWALNLFFQ